MGLMEDYEEAFDSLVNDDLEESIVDRLKMFEEGNTEFVPLSQAVDAYEEFSKHPERRVYTGIKEIDEATRGIAPKEMCVINGFAHNGKTVLVTEILIANEGATCVYFTPDETREVVLIKLAASLCGISAEAFETGLFAGDAYARQQLDAVAARFHNLAVYDMPATLHGMTRYMEAVRHALGPIKYSIFDYADLLQEPTDTRGKLDLLKAWGKDEDQPFFVLHQSSRTSGAGGKEQTITSGGYGSEQQATFQIGVRRKINMYRDQIRQLEDKMEHSDNGKVLDACARKIADIKDNLIPRHMDTITVNLNKNKRPPMRLVTDLDFRLMQDTGRLIPIRKYDEDEEPDMPRQAAPVRSTGSARDQLFGGK